MADEPLLTDLCRICNNNTPKYCCPRCKCLTCSLPCYKRHQTWSQCSGKRDPAAYMKPSQLATAAGIDHDYNFLTGIERAFDKADRDAEDRGIRLEPRFKKDTTGTRRMQRLLQDAKVVIRRAPKGMSRQKENLTHCRNSDGHDSILWTVEWILPDGSRRLRGCTEDDSVVDAYNSVLKDKAASKSRKRKRTGKMNALGRDDKFQHSSSSTHIRDTSPLDQDNVAGALEPKPEVATSNNQAEESKTAVRPSNVQLTGQTNSANSATITAADEQRSPVHDTYPTVDNNDTASKAVPNTGVDNNAAKSVTGPPTPYFYLHRPLSTSSSRILIPLSSSATLHHSLSNQTVLEFPTIYVLHEPPNALPPGMQLEHDYLRRARQLVNELDEELKDFTSEGYGFVDGDGAPTELDNAGFDESKVLETLKRDVAAVGRDVVR